MRTDVASMDAVISKLAQNEGRLTERNLVRTPISFETNSPKPSQLSRVQPDRYPVDLLKALESRESSLQYGNGGISVEKIASMVHGALLNDRDVWELEQTAGLLEAFVFAFKSTDWPTGIYRITSSAITYIGSLEEIGSLDNLGIQKEFVSGAGIVSIYASLDHADQWAGSHGYRIACLRASMALYDFHLRSFEKDYIGSIFGGFIPSSVRQIIKSDGVTRHPLLAAAYGLHRE